MQVTRPATSSAVLFALLALASSARADVIVVDQANGPGTDFTAILPAVEAAQDGDTILVRPGDYFQFLTFHTNRSFALIGDGPGVRIDSIQLQSYGAATTVLIRGFEIAFDLAFTPQISVDNCLGNVWIEDVTTPPSGIGGGVIVSGCPSVVITNCSFGASIINQGTLIASQSGLHLSDTSIRARDCCGIGLWVQDSDVQISGGTLHGGSGRDAFPNGGSCHPAVAGAPAIEINGASSIVVAQGADLIGGPGGAGISAQCPAAPDGPGMQVNEGTGLELSEPARSLSHSSPTRVGQMATLDFAGEPGDVAVVYYAPSMSAGTSSPLWTGELLLSLPTKRLGFALIPAAGALTLNVPIGAIGGAQVLDVFVQALFLDAGGDRVMSSGSLVHLLDAAF